MKAPVHLAPKAARLAEAVLEQANLRIDRAIADLQEGKRLTEQALRMIRVAPAKLRDGDQQIGCELLPAWHSAIGGEWVRVADLRKCHPTTALGKCLQSFDAGYDNETDASQALGSILGRLAASGADFNGYVLRLRGKLGNVNQWECCPLNPGEDSRTVP